MKFTRHASFGATMVAFLVCSLQLAGQAGDTVLRPAGPPRHQGVAELAPEQTIGNGGGSDFEFDKIARVLPTRDGFTWVIDGSLGADLIGTFGGPPAALGTSQVRVFDADGRLVRRVGRRGNGPGEWQTPMDIAELPGGRVAMTDAGIPTRLTFYRANGVLDTIWSLNTLYHSVTADTAGVVWLTRTGRPARPSGRDGAPAVPVLSAPARARFGRGAEPLDSLRAPESACCPRRNDLLSRPFQVRHSTAWSPHGYYASAVTSAYTIYFHRPGNTVLAISRSLPVVSVSEAERRDHRAYVQALARYLGPGPGRGIPEIPSTKPPVTRLRFDLDGRLWVQVATPSERFAPPPAQEEPGGGRRPVLAWREPQEYDVFEPSGQLIGRVRLPYDATVAYPALITARGDRIWLVTSDADDVQTVVRYRIVWK